MYISEQTEINGFLLVNMGVYLSKNEIFMEILYTFNY